MTLPYFIYQIASGIGVGKCKYAPGTVATLVIGIPSYFIIHTFFKDFYFSILFVETLLGIWICSIAEKWSKKTDDPAIIWDEICGYQVAMIGVDPKIETVVMSFLLFRFFDIYKPFPIRWIDGHIKGGLGIMLDDLLAGFFSMLILLCFAV